MNLKSKIGYFILILYPIFFSACVADYTPQIQKEQRSGLYKYDRTIREYEYGTLRN